MGLDVDGAIAGVAGDGAWGDLRGIGAGTADVRCEVGGRAVPEDVDLGLESRLRAPPPIAPAIAP